MQLKSLLPSVVAVGLANTALGAPASATTKRLSTLDKRQQTCTITVEEAHSYGGGGPGQEVLDECTGGINVRDESGNLVYHDSDDRQMWKQSGISAGTLGIASDIYISTQYERASSHFTACRVTYQGVNFDVAASDHIDSGIVSVSTSRCTWWIPCFYQ